MDRTNDRANDRTSGRVGDRASGHSEVVRSSGSVTEDSILQARGGLPSFCKLVDHLGSICSETFFSHQYIWLEFQRFVSKSEEGDLVTDEIFLDEIRSGIRHDVTYGTVSITKGSMRDSVFMGPDLSSPYQILVPINCNIDCHMYITERIMDARRLWCYEPWFVNGYHKLCFERNYNTSARLLKLECDETIRSLVCQG